MIPHITLQELVDQLNEQLAQELINLIWKKFPRLYNRFSVVEQSRKDAKDTY